MDKLSLDMTGQQAMMAMCQGNPGALQVLCEMVKNDDFVLMFTCDDMGLYGSELYMLWSDCCGRDYALTKNALVMYAHGKITAEKFLENVRGDGRGLPIEKWGFLV